MVLLPDVPAIVLNVPIIISLIAIVRYVIGFKTWKNYPVLALTLAYYFFYQVTESLILSLLVWTFFTALIIGTAILTRYFIRKYKINYYARVAVMFLGATFFSLIAMALFAQLGFTNLVTNQFFGLGIFLVASTIDELASLLFKKDKQEFIRRVISTTATAAISGLLITWAWWNTLLVSHHEILIAILALDVIVAFWTAARFTEYLRFGSILKDRR